MLVSCPYFITAGTAKNNITVVTSINRVVIILRLGVFDSGIDIFTACAALDRIAPFPVTTRCNTASPVWMTSALPLPVNCEEAKLLPCTLMPLGAYVPS